MKTPCDGTRSSFPISGTRRPFRCFRFRNFTLPPRHLGPFLPHQNFYAGVPVQWLMCMWDGTHKNFHTNNPFNALMVFTSVFFLLQLYLRKIVRILLRSRFTRYRQTFFCKLYRNVWCVYSTTFPFGFVRQFTRNYVIQDMICSIQLPIDD